MGEDSRELDEKTVGAVGGACLIAILLLPHVQPGMFGWLIGLVPLPIFIGLTFSGFRQGAAHLGICLLIATGVAAWFGVVRPLVFSLTLVPLGFILAGALRQRQAPLRTGLTGVVILAGTWLLFATALGVIDRFNPYATLLGSLDEGLTAAYALYREAAGVPDAELLKLQTTFDYLRQGLPKILPAMLTTGVLFTVWANMALGNWLLRRIRPQGAAWPEFSLWQLPDRLVWGFIAAAAGTLILPGGLRIFCLNLLLIWAALFFLQGLAVLVRLLLRLRTPRPLRIVIYLFLGVQAYGIILLSLLGLADIWADFRKLGPGRGSNKTSLPPSRD